MYIKRCIYIIALLGLTACGGGESASTKEVTDAAPVINLPQPSIPQSFDLTGQSGVPLSSPQKVAGIQSDSNSTISASFSNATGTLRFANPTSSVEGNLTFGVKAADTDEMKQVSLYLPNAERSFVLCADNCAVDFQATITGFNPQFANEAAGSLRIELIVEDSLGNSAVVDAMSVNWQPIQISALSASRQNGIVSVEWSGNSKLERYNLYAATELGITASNAIELDNGIQQLAISGTAAQFVDADPSKNYHLLVTGIDNGGESGKSVPYSIAKLGGAANLPPVANNDNYQVNEDQTLTVNALENDFDPEGLSISIDSIILPPFNGTLTQDEQGNITYVPSANFHGSDSASYRIIDAEGATAEATITFEVLSINDNPIAVDDTYGVDVSGIITVGNSNILSNDSDIDGDQLSVLTTPVTPPQRGTLVLNADGRFAYQSNGLLTENDQFVYQVNDSNGGTATATVTILPNGNAVPPTAINDNYSTNEDTTLVISSANLGILANDSDPNDLSFELQETLLLQPQHGRLNIVPNGTFTYIPDSNFFGVDQFQYQIMNSAGLLAQAFVMITVNPTADIPIALDDNYQTQEDTQLVVSASNGLLVNDVNFDDSTLTVNTTPVSVPQNGSLVLADDGSFSYLPRQDFNGVDSFTYQIINGTGLTNTANVNISVIPLNDAPVAVNDIASTNEDTKITVDVLANDIDTEGDTLSITSVSLENATAAILNGKLDITPALNFFGNINVTYTITDSINAPSTGMLVLTVLPINDAPIAVNDTYNLAEDAVLRVLVSSKNHLLSNDSDVDGDTLTVNTTPVTTVNSNNFTINTTPLSDVTNGSLTLNSDGSFTYIPNVNFFGSDSFTYEISDGNGGTAQANVTLTIAALNDAPVALNDSYSFAEDFTWVRAVTDGDQLLSNDTDADGDTLTVNITPITDVNNGSLTLGTDGSFTYIPDADFFSQDSFTYEISDGKGGTAQATVTLIVNAVNDIPVLVSNTKSFTFDEDSTLNRSTVDSDNLLSGASDVDGDSLTVMLVSGVTSNGSLTVNNDGSFQYIPNLNVNGIDADTFTYKVIDGKGGESETVTVALNIQAVNDAPIPGSASYTFGITEVATDGDVVGTVSATDVENDDLVYSLSAGDTGLFQIDSSSGEITVKGTFPLDFETDTSHTLTATITDNGSPTIAASDVLITINVIDVLGDARLEEQANFGRTEFGSLELTGLNTQAQLTDSVNDGTKVYFVGSIDNLDKDIYMVAYNDDGSLDISFGNNGIKTFDYGANEYAKAIVTIAGNYFITFERSENNYTEVCFIKVNNTGNIDVSFGDSGLRCTTEQKILTINDAVAFVIPATQGNPLTDIDTVVAVGKVQGPTDDDLLVIRVDENGNFQTSTTFVNNVEVVYSPHIMLDITGLGLDDEGIAVYNPHNNEAMIAGNVLTANGDYDIFAWIFNPKNTKGDYDDFNGSTPKTYDVSAIGADDKVGGIDGENTGSGGHTAHIAGSTVNAGGEQDAFIIELDSFAAFVPGFAVNGIGIYDVDGVAGGTGEFTGYTYNYLDDDMYLTGNVFDGVNSKPFATRILLDGSVDSLNYGINGYQFADYSGANAFAKAMSLDSGKGMWVAGYVEDGSDKDMTITAFDSSGDLYNQNDMVNGKNTLTHSSIYSDDSAVEIVQIQNGVQTGKYLMAAIADDTTNQHIVLTRLTSAGQLDTTFDSDGIKQLKIGTSAKVNGMFELASGNFIVYGNVTEGISTNGFVARIDQNGVLDTSFANNGIYTTSAIPATNIHFNQVKVDTSGRIIAVGNFESGSTNALVLRLTSAGALDMVFNTLGTAGYVIGADTDDYMAVAIDSSDNIYAAGNRLVGDKDLLMVKYLTTGIQDNDVNVDINSGIDESVEQLLFDSNGDLYWIGNDLGSSAAIVIVKSNTSGVLDNSFSGNGKASFTMSSLLEFGAEARVSSAVIDSNDNIVLVGYSDIALVKQKKMLARIKSNGSLDNAFDYNGYFRSSTCPNSANLESIILLNNSSFVVAGQCYLNGIFKNNIEISHYILN